jgi:hypothetical protein
VTDDDRIYGLGALQSPPDERDYLIAQLYEEEGIVPPPAAAIPDTYLAPGPQPPILDQNGYPECTAYSTSRLKSWQDRKDLGKFYDFNEHLFFQVIGGTQYGAFVRDALDRMLKVGYPVVGSNEANLHRIAAYYNVPTTKLDIQQAVMAFGPLVIATSWYRSWYKPDANGVLRAPDVSVGGHAILIEGWDPRGARLPNSWGEAWGINGVCYMPWAYVVNAWEAWKTVDVITPKPPVVTFKYGGYAGYRGTYRVKANGSRVRSRPYTTAPIVAILAAGALFKNAQTTDSGTLVNGSRRWYGDATGNRWIHSSLVTRIG